MKIKNLQMKKALRTVLFVLLLCAAGMTKAQTENITFADANVKAICVANWDTDGDGELNTTEAAAVTSLDGMFMFDDGITSFNELQFFTGLTSFGEDEFNSCTSLATITIPNAVTSIGNYAFSDCSSLTTMTSYACTPPALGNDVFYNVPSMVILNVPCHTSAMYQEADGWSDFSNYEEFEYGLCPIPFADATVKAICVAHWDTNEDGELSYAEAAAVTNLGTYFKSTAITSFDELEYFTSLTSLPNTAFYGCTSLASIALPSSVLALGNGSFYNCTSLSTMTIYAETPPTVGTNAFKNVPTDMAVYVPCGTYAAYHTANSWSEFTILQQSGLCPIVFADANVKALCVANWDTNGDGELSYDEAAAVTDLGEVFKNKFSIISFDELQYFINLTTIGNYAFRSCTSLTSVEIPNSVTSIGSYAFSNCTSLTSVEIPNSVTSIGSYAFSNCTSLTSVEIPNSMTLIGNHAFYYCTSLISVEIPNSVTSIETNPFSGCSGLEQIVVASDNAYYDSRENCNAIIRTSNDELVTGCKNALIPNSVTFIGYEAFRSCYGLTSIDIPNSVTTIGDYAFNYCNNLTSVELPNSVTSIGYSAFSDCSSLTSVDIPNSVTSISSYAFCYCSSLTSVDIPSSVTWIGTNPFGGCSGLEQIVVASDNAYYDSRENCNAIIRTSNNALVVGCKNTVIPSSVTSIAQYAFSNCSSLTSVDIPNSVTSISSYAFYYCTSLTSVEIPNSVTSIGNGAFYNCTGLTSVASFADTPPTLGNDVFYSVNKSIPVYVPCGTTETYQSTNGWNEFTNMMEMCAGEVTVTINPTEGGTVTGAGYYPGGEVCVLTATPNQGYVFGNWTENGRAVSSDSVYSFYAHPTTIIANFWSISPIVFADADVKALCVANWDNNGDGELSYVEAAAVTDLGQVFRNNSIITSFNELQYFINLTSIGGAFAGCSSLTSIAIPNTVTSIGTNAFYNCTSLTSVEIPNTVTTIELQAFSYCSGLASIEIPNSVTFIGQSAFWDCTSLTSIEIPSSVTSMGHNPFAGCNGLEQIIVETGNPIYDSRDNCNAIIKTSTNEMVVGCKNSVIPNSVTYLGGAFYRCGSLTTIVIPNSVISIESWAFCNCSGLNSISIGNSMTSIGEYAFTGCSNLNTMTIFAETPPSANSSVFSQVPKTIPVYVPCSSLEDYQSASGWNDFTNYIEMCPGTITVVALPAEGGSVTGGGPYEGGATCTLTATANHDYRFLNWTENGEVVSFDAEYTFTVAGDRSLVANFTFMPPAPVVAEYYPDSNEPNSPYVKVHWAASLFEAQIGEGTSTFGYFPFYTLYNYSISENLFLASELEEAGVNTAPMTSLSWYATNAPGYEQQGISIWMANVSDTGLTTTSHTVNDMTLVYTGAMTPEIGWNEFVFNEGNFAWDGVSNVLIYCQRNNGTWNNTVYWQATANLPFNASSYKYQDASAYNPNVAQSMTISTTRPNIIMKYEGQMIYNLYRANCDGTDAQLIAENLNDTQYIDETWWQLENDSYKYGVSVADSTNTDIFWSNCIENNFNPTAFHFITAGNWNNAANWQYGALPGVYDIVFIDADCQLDMNTEVAELTVSNGQSLTLQPGKTLTVTGDLTNTSTEGLVIKDGAQLINASDNVAATMEKDIAAYSDSNPDAWYTIASPMNEMPIVGSNFATPEFDLYRFNESNLTDEEWENYKANLADFTTFENGRGYLFANSNAFSPAFTGTLNASAVTCPLSYTERPNDPLSGFNLIGNPFPHDIYKGTGAAIDNANLASGYYTLTNEGTWQVHTFEDAIHPGQGILVKATASTVLTIAKSTAVATSETGVAKRETSPLSISVKGENGMNQAFVYFGRGNSMEKLGGFVAQEPSLWVRDNGKDYAIAHMEKACETLELCFSSKQSGDFILTIDRNETEFEYLQLVDHVTGLTVDLLEQSTYVFPATGQEPDARFSIRFKVVE